MTRTATGALVLVSAVSLAAGALAAEGTLPVRAGDTITGTLVRCGDRQAFEAELVRGEKIRVLVALDDPTAPPQLRIEAPDATDVTASADIHATGSIIQAGPFKAPLSGIYRFTLTSSSAHLVHYEATSSVVRRHRQVVRVPANGRTVSVLAAAGSTLTLETKHGTPPALVVGFPGGTPREIVPGDPMLAVLASGGLGAPSAGVYTFRVASGSAARIVVTPPMQVAPARIGFPALPGEDSVTTWYADTGWVATPGAVAVPAGHDPTAPALPGVTPAPSAWMSVISNAVAASAASPPAQGAGAAAVWLGPAAGIGMPLAAAPSLGEVIASGVASDTAAGRSYRLTVPRTGLGDVTYRVNFTVDGRPSAAPLELTGRVAMAWSVTSGAPSHAGYWTIALDPVRHMTVINGSESLTDGAARTVFAAAYGFVVTTDAPTWPSGSLTWSLDDPRSAVTLARRETYDGTPTVRVAAGATFASALTADVALPR